MIVPRLGYDVRRSPWVAADEADRPPAPEQGLDDRPGGEPGRKSELWLRFFDQVRADDDDGGD